VNAWGSMCFALALVAPAAFLGFGTRVRWMILGVVSWVFGVIAKNVLFYGMEVAGESGWPLFIRGAMAGMVSAACELGAAAIFLKRKNVRFVDAVGFGVAIGAFEILFVMAIGALDGLEEVGETLRFVGQPFGFVTGMFLFERVFALVGHTSARILIYMAVQKRGWAPAIFAFLMFSFVDGLASYGAAANWDWENAALNWKFQATVAAAALLEAGAVWWFGQDFFRTTSRKAELDDESFSQ
jgi:hypothetical protein